MKRRIVFLMLLTLFNFSYAHKQNVHQYICIEAYKLLRLQLGGDFKEMSDHLGGMDAYYIGDGLWRTGFTTGAGSIQTLYTIFGLSGNGIVSIPHRFNSNQD